MIPIMMSRPPTLTHVMTLRVQVGTPLEVGQVPRGRRRVIPILGGTFEGPTIRGNVLPGGADWQIVRADGSPSSTRAMPCRPTAGASSTFRTPASGTHPRK